MTQEEQLKFVNKLIDRIKAEISKSPESDFFYHLLWWLKQCWRHKPRRTKCGVCDKIIWTHGEPMLTVCSTKCGDKLVLERI